MPFEWVVIALALAFLSKIADAISCDARRRKAEANDQYRYVKRGLCADRLEVNIRRYPGFTVVGDLDEYCRCMAEVEALMREVLDAIRTMRSCNDDYHPRCD